MVRIVGSRTAASVKSSCAAEFMSGYWGNPEKTVEATRGGWLRTGDVGTIDADGYVTMRGRRSELIEVGGTTWFPRDVEEALCGLPGVRQAALIGVPNRAGGVRPRAFVTLDRSLTVDGDALKAGILGLTAYDLTPLVVEVVDELPMTPTGKIAKADLLARCGEQE